MNVIYRIDVLIDERIYGSGQGRTKKSAEQAAAKAALTALDNLREDLPGIYSACGVPASLSLLCPGSVYRPVCRARCGGRSTVA